MNACFPNSVVIGTFRMKMPFPFSVIRIRKYHELTKARDSLLTSQRDVEFLASLAGDQGSKFLSCRKMSHSSIGQDLFVLSELQFKRDGYFVEFGATDGITSSNTYLLEREFGWRGILAEPAHCWHQSLRNNRSSHIEELCVWSSTGETLVFNEIANTGISTIDAFTSTDHHKKERRSGTRYEISTISLLDLLRKYNAPQHIDYLSIDSEGSEFEILKAFDFSQYQFSVITCEHNHTKRRDDIFRLLTARGYRRKFENVSQVDDWYTNLEPLQKTVQAEG
jgi:FkbM family methyltransferase